MYVLNGIQSNKHNYLFTSVDEIFYMLTGRISKKSLQSDRTLAKNIKIGLTLLSDKKIIKIIDSSDNNYLLENYGFVTSVKENKVIILEDEEIHNIFTNCQNPFNVTAFYSFIIGTINNLTKEWHMSQDNIVQLFGGSKTTINDYFTQLENIDLLYVHRSQKRLTDNSYRNVSNSYGRKIDKKKIELAALEYLNSIKTKDEFHKLNRRQIKLQYNAFCNGSKKYKKNQELINELKNDCIKYNLSLEKKPIEDKENNWEPRELLDLSVFSKQK